VTTNTFGKSDTSKVITNAWFSMKN